MSIVSLEMGNVENSEGRDQNFIIEQWRNAFWEYNEEGYFSSESLIIDETLLRSAILPLNEFLGFIS